MVAKSTNINSLNRILCLAVAYMTLLALLITAWAQVDIAMETILSFESSDLVTELTVAKGTAVPDLPHTLRAVVELQEIQPETVKPHVEPTDEPLELVTTPTEAEQPSGDSGEASLDTEVASTTPEVFTVNTKVSQVFASVPFTGFFTAPEIPSMDTEELPDFIPAEPDDAWGYEAADGGLYTYTSESGAISYRVYGSYGGSQPAWFACDENGNVYGMIKEIPVTWVCKDFDKDMPGAYTFTATFEGYIYAGDPPFAIVILGAEDLAPGNDIGGRLWLDENADGVMDEGESGIAGYPVSLYTTADTATAVQTTETVADGTYQFENLEPGSYMVGIAAETVAETEYLLPVTGLAGDNKFAINEEVSVAYSETVAVAADTDIAVENVHAGMRQMTFMAAEVTVSTAQGFIQAVNSNTEWKITLADDIVIEYGMTDGEGNWNSQYQNTAQPGFSGQPQGILVGNKANAGGNGSFEIDGQGHKIIFNWPHTIVERGNFYFPTTNSVKSFTMKDVTWYGSSEVGCYFPAGNVTENVSITFDNVTYKGPGMGDIAIYPEYNPQVLFKNCAIAMSYRNGSGGSGVDSDGYGGSLPASGSALHGALWQDTHASETIAANFITFEGNNTITKQDSPADGGSVLGDIDPIFYIYWAENSYVKVADGASLIIHDEAGKTKQSVYTTGLIGTHTQAYSTPFNVGENATFEYHHIGGGNGFITDYYKLGSFTIGKNASVVFDIKADTRFTANDVSAHPAYFVADSISVAEGAKWTYVADYAGSAATARSSMIRANTISVAEGADVNIIAKNNSVAETLIALQDSISFTNPRSVVLFNSKNSSNTYVIRTPFISSSNASVSIKTNTIRSWRLESSALLSGEIVFGSQTALAGNYITSPDPSYQWVLDGAQYTATLNSGEGAVITNYSQGHSDIFNLSGTRTLGNINVLELRAEIPPLDFVFYKKNENHGVLSGVKFELYPQDNTGTGWDMAGGMQAVSAADGKVLFAGLETGDYLLAEVETAPGYMLPTGRWKITVDTAMETIAISAVPDSGGTLPPAFFTDAGVNNLPNYRKLVLPRTGGIGTILFTVVGIVLVGVAVILLILSRKKKR